VEGAPFYASAIESHRPIQWAQCSLSIVAGAAHNRCAEYQQKSSEENATVTPRQGKNQTSDKSTMAPNGPPALGIP
jgi:hypothetical protein